MRYLILSDIHGNGEGLAAVLAATAGQYEQILCCGDLVGYGPNPNEICDWMRETVPAVIRGNHDKVCSGVESMEDFNPFAKQAASWTMQALTAENRAWLAQLPMGPMQVEDFHLVHGSPRHEDEYVIEGYEAGTLRDELRAWLTFFGHTHLQGGFQYRRGKLIVLGGPHADEERVTFTLDKNDGYLINPGSAGQPRDGDWRVGAAIFDSKDLTVELLRVPYAIEETQRKIRQVGLPTLLADRLSRGV